MTAATKARSTKKIRTLARGVVPIIALYLEVGWRGQGFQTRFRLHGLGADRLDRGQGGDRWFTVNRCIFVCHDTTIFIHDESVGRSMVGSLLVSRRQPFVPCAGEQMEAGRDFIDACVAARMGGGARAGDWEGCRRAPNSHRHALPWECVTIALCCRPAYQMRSEDLTPHRGLPLVRSCARAGRLRSIVKGALS